MKRHFALLPLVALLSACGNSNDDSAINTTLPSVITGALTAVHGTMLTINQNTTIDAADASIETGSNSKTPIELQTLKPGMMLQINTADNKATSIVFDSQLQAQATFDPIHDQLTMAGITVYTKDAKLAPGLELSKLPQNTFLEVSGYYIDSTHLQATYIEVEDDFQPQTELEGRVTALNGETFKLGQLTIDFSQAAQKPAAIKNGDWVEVEGNLNGLTLTASEVEVDQPDYDKDASLEMQGVVSWISSKADHLVINQTQAVTLQPSTQYEGITADAIKPGMVLEVEGHWNLDSMTLMATEVEREDAGEPTIPVNASEFELEGKAEYHRASNTVTVNGYSFTVTPQTELDDGLALDNLQNYSWVSVSGYEQNNHFIALEIEPETQETTVELQGKVVINNNKQYTLWGYQASDDSLKKFATGPFSDKTVELECYFNFGEPKSVYGCSQELDD
ncbi:lipoprotein [Shewanella sp. NFH-SH190041]|uniref:DUF5666 domain-containing protein n=1 Tax=Shewanella sp. NFH-SH190041 TaxID=2950245 RepID=UPI0021C452ED|nr:DUF5666 domain-containing protein [Shewanella sp. NFH-SH190041]BDM65585.1 lipoprotein [Shewanella sp. NFH-SH190041]